MSNRLSWLEDWLRGERFSTITNHSRRSEKTIKETVRLFLEIRPSPQPISNQTCYLVIDATWFGRKNCLIVYWDTVLEKAQWWRYSQNKETATEITADLEALKEKGVRVVGVTSDGAPGIKTALDNVFPGIPHQRCLVHLQRLSLIFLTQRPRTQAGWELRNLIMQLNQITTHNEQYIWRKDFFHWCNKYYSFLKERSFYSDRKYWWYTHRYLRRIRRMIVNALPDMWRYLDNQRISKDTNGLEGRWSSLKIHYRQHRGLSVKRMSAYLSWYLTVVVNKEKTTRNYL